MGHAYYQNATNHETERTLLAKMLIDALANDYCPWEGPGLDVESAAGKWDFLKVRLIGNDVIVTGLHGEHIFPLVISN